MVMDAVDSFYVFGFANVGGATTLYHFTAAGTMLTLNVATNPAGSSTLSGAVSGVSPAANKLLVGTSNGTFYQLQYYSYAANVISVMWSVAFQQGASSTASGQPVQIYDLDGANGWFAIYDNGSANGNVGPGVYVIKLDLSNGSILHFKRVGLYIPASYKQALSMVAANSSSLQIAVNFGGGEFGFISDYNEGNVSATFFAYLDLRNLISPGQLNNGAATTAGGTAGYSSEQGVAFRIYGMANGNFYGFTTAAFDQTTRTLVVRTQPAVLSGNHNFLLQSYQIPRR
jgi:hypothetical protein